jgi:hypothetical protein
MSATIPDLVVPDRIGEVLGWRAWQLVGDVEFPRLMSPAMTASSHGADAIWPTNRWFEAKCASGCMDVPSEPCGCGLYAANTLERLADLGLYGRYRDLANAVIGEVAFAGKVIEAWCGYRAERGRISRAWLPAASWKFAKPLSEAYGVPVGIFTGGGSHGGKFNLLTPEGR